MNASKSRWCWRKDLSEFRGLSDRERAGFLLVLEWFENFRLRYELDAGREAARVFWRAEVLREGVTQPELEKAKSRFLTGQLLQRETNNGKASELGEAAVIYGDASRVNTDLAKLQAVTATEVQEALNRYISGKKKVVIQYLPEAMKPAGPAKEVKKS